MADDPEVPSPQDDHVKLRAIDGGKTAAEARAIKARVQGRRLQAYELWLAHVSFEKIAELTGVSLVQATRDVAKAAADVNKQHRFDVDGLRSKQYWQRARIIRGLWTKAVSGDSKAAEAIDKHLTAQAKLYGLDRPIKIATTTPDGEQWAPSILALQKLTVDELKLLQSITDERLLPTGTDVIDVEPEK